MKLIEFRFLAIEIYIYLFIMFIEFKSKYLFNFNKWQHLSLYNINECKNLCNLNIINKPFE